MAEGRRPQTPDPPGLPAFLQQDGLYTRLTVRVVPRSGRTALAGERAGALLVRLAAAPVEGTANDALLAFLAACLEVPARAVTLTAGMRSRDKRIRIEGLTPHQAAPRLERHIRRSR